MQPSSGWRAASTTSPAAPSSPAGDFYFVDARWQRIHRWSAKERRLTTVADAPLSPVNLAFDAAGNLLVVSLRGQRHGVRAEAGDAPGAEPTLLAPQAAAPRPGLAMVLPVGDWRLQRGATGSRCARPHHYLSPDGGTFVSATQDFVDGAMSWGVKSSDLIRAFGLQRARPGERVYLTSEAEVATWSARVGDDGSLSDLRLFVDQGGEGVATDAEGNVYLAAGDVLVYDASGKLIETIRRAGPADAGRVRRPRPAHAVPARARRALRRPHPHPGPVRRNITPRAGRARRGRS